MANTQETDSKRRFAKFTRQILLTEFILFAAGLCFSGLHSFFLLWLLAVVVVNLILIIAHIIEQPKRFPLYIAILFAIPIVTAAVLLSAMTRLGC